MIVVGGGALGIRKLLVLIEAKGADLAQKLLLILLRYILRNG